MKISKRYKNGKEIKKIVVWNTLKQLTTFQNKFTNLTEFEKINTSKEELND